MPDQTEHRWVGFAGKPDMLLAAGAAHRPTGYAPQLAAQVTDRAASAVHRQMAHNPLWGDEHIQGELRSASLLSSRWDYAASIT